MLSPVKANEYANFEIMPFSGFRGTFRNQTFPNLGQIIPIRKNNMAFITMKNLSETPEKIHRRCLVKY
jgi:hypothetical protein